MIYTDFFINVPNVKSDMLKPEFWLNKLNNKDEVLLSAREINNINKKIMNTKQCKMNDLDNEEGYYYGFCTKRTNLKVFPINEFISDDKSDKEYDKYQLEGVLVNEPIVVFDKTSDWAYVKTYNCEGWINNQDIALCSSKEEWMLEKELKEFIVVTGDKFTLEANEYSKEVSEISLYMGTILPLLKKSTIPFKIYGRTTFNNYISKFPIREKEGFYNSKLGMIPINRDVSVGYLPYTYRNLINQMFKCIGNRYGWGGMLNSRDCSSYVLEIYRCFGINLPRNTDEQRLMPLSEIKVTGMIEEEKSNIIRKLNPGTLLYFPGHVMIYLGEDCGNLYVINAAGSITFNDKTQRVRSIIINDLKVKRANGMTWLDEIDIIKSFNQ